MSKMFGHWERILLTLWVGGMWVIGYVVAPVLFNTLDDRQLAGLLAGKMFDAIHVIGLLCGFTLLATAIYSHGKNSLKAWRVWVLLVMLMIIAGVELLIRPGMVELKAQGLFENPQLAAEFAKLHGASSVCYLINSLLGLLIVVKGISRPIRQED